jgi:hypothetical protein
MFDRQDQDDSNDENMLPPNSGIDSSAATAADESKKFKNLKHLAKLKKDIVIKKLMKTIDLMNQQLNKRDQLISSLEKENLIYSKEKYQSYEEPIDEAFLKNEITKLKQEVLDVRNEKDMLNQKIKFLEKQILEMKYEETSFVSEYKDMCEPLKTKFSADKVTALEKNLESENKFLRKELEKMSNQVELLDKQQHLENDINNQFESLISKKSSLEEEIQRLKTKCHDLKEEKNNELIKYYSSQKQYQNQIFELENTINEQNQKLQTLTKTEMQLNEAYFNNETLNEEKRVFIKTINQLHEKVENLHLDRQNQTFFHEKKLETLQADHAKQQLTLDSVNNLNLDLQKQIQKLLADADHKHELNEKFAQKKLDDIKNLKQTCHLTGEKLKYQKLKFESQIEDLKKMFAKELENVKLNHDKAIVNNGELSRSNTSMRTKIKQLELECKEFLEKQRTSRLSLDLAHKQKREAKEAFELQVFGLKREIDCLREQRDEIAKKNNAQQASIEEMLEKMNNFQEEFEYLIKCNTSAREKMEKVQQNCETYKKRYYEMKLYLKKILMEEEQIQKLNSEKQEKQKSSKNADLAISTQVQANLISNLFKCLKLDSNKEILEETLENDNLNETSLIE